MTLSASRTGHPPIKDVGGATSTSAGSPPITQITFLTCRAHYPGGPNRCVSVPSLSARPSPVNRRVGIHDFTFEACSSFTRVTACKIARPPKGGLLSRGSGPASYPTKPLGSYHAHRQLHGWILLPLVICAVGAHQAVSIANREVGSGPELEMPHAA